MILLYSFATFSLEKKKPYSTSFNWIRFVPSAILDKSMFADLFAEIISESLLPLESCLSTLAAGTFTFSNCIRIFVLLQCICKQIKSHTHKKAHPFCFLHRCIEREWQGNFIAHFLMTFNKIEIFIYSAISIRCTSSKLCFYFCFFFCSIKRITYA